MTSPVYAVFRKAILERKQVIFTYQDRYREVCPHTLGLKAGKEQALVFQFAGESSKGLPPGGEWRCLILAQVKDAKIKDGPWHTGEKHTQKQTCVDDVDVEVDH
jgi:hypothetical protein